MFRRSTPLALAFAIALAGCHRERHTSAHEEAKCLVTSPFRTNTELTRDYVAQVRAIQHIEVRALERGYLQGIYVDEGQRVAKGARMFQVMPVLYQAELQKANAEAELSQIELSNTKLLADKNVVSPNELALSQAKLSRSKAEVALAKAQRSLTEIRAPFDGIMGRFQVRMGSLIDEGSLLTTLSDNSSVWVYFNVSEVEYLAYKAQPEAERPVRVGLVMANGQLFDEAGKIETIEADFNNETGNIAMRATFPNPKGLLRHGETGKVRVKVPLAEALLVPQKATFDVLDKKFVFVVDEHGVVRSRPITIAAEMPQVYAIASGLGEHDRILVEGLRKVRDGATIEVDYKEPADVMGHLEVSAE